MDLSASNEVTPPGLLGLCHPSSRYNWFARPGTRAQVGILPSDSSQLLQQRCIHQGRVVMPASCTGRGTTALYLRSLDASPAPIFQTFTALITLRLDLRYVPWSDLQTVGYLVHLQHLHLSEHVRHKVAEPQDRAFTRKMSKHGSPFSCLTGLRSLELELFESSSADLDCDGTKAFLQPISCMNNLQGFTLLGLSTNIGIQHLSQLSQLTSLGVGHVEDGLSTLVKLKHLQAEAMSPPTWLQRPTVGLSATLVTLTNLRRLDCTLVQYCQVSHLTVLTALQALTIGLMHDIPFDHQSRSHIAIWSDLAELKHLDTLYVHSDAFMDVKDFQAIALLSCLTKLHFEGFTSDLNFKPEDMNKLSALASLQYLYLEFTHSGGWCDAVDELDIHLRALLNGANMQYFEVISGECDYDD